MHTDTILPFDSIEFALLYDARSNAFGYPGKLLEYIKSYCRENRVKTICDVGAGTGSFSIPLALEGFTIYAVEPGYGMYTVLLNKINTINTPCHAININVYHTYIEHCSHLRADICIAMHSLYGTNIPKAISVMLSISPITIIAVRTESTHTLSDVVRQYFKRERAKNVLTLITSFCASHNIFYETFTIHEEITVTITDLYQEALYHCHAMRLHESYIPFIISILKENLMYRNGRYQYNNIHSDAIVIIKQATTTLLDNIEFDQKSS